jgi:thioredoxin-related protein
MNFEITEKNILIPSIFIFLAVIIGITYYNKTDNFHQIKKNTKNTANNNIELILFSSPKCPACRNFMKEWEKIKKIYKNSSVKLINIDCSKGNCPSKYNVYAIPYIRIRCHGEEDKYSGPMTAKEISNFVNNLI